jgi:hypothetical protein
MVKNELNLMFIRMMAHWLVVSLCLALVKRRMYGEFDFARQAIEFEHRNTSISQRKSNKSNQVHIHGSVDWT